MRRADDSRLLVMMQVLRSSLVVIVVGALIAPVRGADAGAEGLTTRPATVPATPTTAKTEVPLIYDQRLNPKPLAPSDVTAILEFTKKVAPIDRPVWYIHVHNCQVLEGRSGYSTTVFFVPDKTSARLRSGRCVYVDSRSFEFWPTYVARVKDAKYEVAEYLQVSETEPSLKADLELPSALLWPFIRPKGVSEVDTIALVDVVRAEMRHASEVGRPVLHPNAPIHNFVLEENGDITVFTGSQQGPLAGSGDTFRCKKRDGKWVVMDVGMWVS